MPNDVPNEALLTDEEAFDAWNDGLHKTTDWLATDGVLSVAAAAAAKAYAVGLRDGEATGQEQVRVIVALAERMVSLVRAEAERSVRKVEDFINATTEPRKDAPDAK